MSEFLYEVGDEYEGSPIQQSRFISEVLTHGGLVGIDGNIVRILYLPGKGSIFDDEPAPAPEPVVEEVVEAVEEIAPAPEPEVEVFENEGGAVEEAPKPAPKRAGRPRKSPVTEAE